MGRAGVPDIIACFKGHFLAIEAKAGKNKPTALQEREIANIRKAGGHAMVLNEDNLDLLEFLIKHLSGEEHV
jgi:Holliday junction resolvase